MDPNTTLVRILELTSKISQAADLSIAFDAIELAELIQNLDSWLSSGGFLPTRWERSS